MNKTFTVLRGLPGSGKTTRAMSMLKADPNLVRVNKDDLRDLLFKGKQWDHSLERTVLDAEKLLVKLLLAKDKNIVIDNTNFNDKYVKEWSDIAKMHGYDFNLIDIETPVEQCILNDAARPKPVGEKVIMDMAMKYNKLAKSTAPWIGVDLDGTLADITVRRTMSLKDNGKLNYAIFFDPDNIKFDVPRLNIIEEVNKFKTENACQMIILSGRSDRTRAATEKWLKDAGVQYDRLIMRPEGNSIKDDILKLQFLDWYCNADTLIKIWDDRPSVIRAWRSRGIEVVDVGNGVEF